jgi:hypothetical protein
LGAPGAGAHVALARTRRQNAGSGAALASGQRAVLSDARAARLRARTSHVRLKRSQRRAWVSATRAGSEATSSAASVASLPYTPDRAAGPLRKEANEKPAPPG